MRGVSCVFAGAAVILGQAGKHDGGHHEGGKKHGGVAGVGYVEESGIVGYSCHEGWEPQGDGPGMVCIHKEKLPLLPHCPMGILEGDFCLLREPAIFSCPPGFVEVGGSHGGKKHGGKKHGGHEGGKKHGHDGPLCMQVERIPYEPYCPTGTALTGGQCLRREIAPATMICPLDQWGGKKHGGHEGGHEGKKHSYVQPACIETIDVLPILTCPPLLTLQGTACIGTGEGPCPVAEPMPLILDGKKHKHGDYRRLGEDDEVIENTGEPLLIGAGPEGDNVSIGEAGVDERRLGEKHGHGEGGKKHGGYGAPVLPPVPSKMKMCDLQIIEPAIPACPPGSFETGGHHGGKKHGGHGGHGGKKHGGGLSSTGLLCSQTVDVPLEPYCPMAGAVLNPATMSCESSIYEAEMRKCPLGFEPCDMGSGKKDKHGHGGKKHHGNSGGYGLGGCCAVAYADPLPGCPVHATLFGAQCVIKHQPIFDCPPGSVRNGEKCYIIQTKPPKIHYQINVTTKQATPLIETSHKKHKKHH